MIWGAPIYYGTEDYSVKGGDTYAWVDCMQNLIHEGTFTSDPNYEDGKFFRPPGYSFFFMPFYIISGFNLKLMFLMAQIVQVLLDTLSIWLIYKIVKNVNGLEELALASGILYCIYPFAIVWAPFLYPETPSIFFLLFSIYYLTKPDSISSNILSGALLGFAVLLRLQIIFAIIGFVYFLFKKRSSFKLFFYKPTIYFFFAFLVIYGSWPLRNLCYGKLVFSQVLQNDKHFSADFMAYTSYIWSVKTDHNPQFEQIIHGQKVEWPKASYLHPEDSTTLDSLAILSNNCGRGFSYFKASAGLIDKPIKEENECTKFIAATFTRLRAEQIKENPFHFYITVPFSNLKKALFKISLNGEKSILVKAVSTILFSYRTLFIFLGLAGIYINKKRQMISNSFLISILLYFILWYSVICFSYRNMEMRYLLMNDILLLIPAGITLIAILEKVGFKLKTSE